MSLDRSPITAVSANFPVYNWSIWTLWWNRSISPLR